MADISSKVPTTVIAGVLAEGLAMAVTVVANVIKAAVVGSAVQGLLAVIVGIGVGAFILYKLYTGRNWMRVLLTVFAVLGTLFVVIGLATPSIGAGLLDVIGVVAQDVAIVLLWLTPSREYFSGTNRARPSIAPNEP